MVANGMKVAHLMTLKQKHYPRLSEWDRCNLKGPLELPAWPMRVQAEIGHPAWGPGSKRKSLGSTSFLRVEFCAQLPARVHPRPWSRDKGWVCFWLPGPGVRRKDRLPFDLIG